MKTIKKDEVKTKEQQLEDSLDYTFKGTSFQDYNYNGFDNFDDLYEDLQEQINQEEVIYYSNAMEYLLQNDPSLQLSCELANDMGYTLKDINSELLATILQQQNLHEELNSLRDDIENCFEEESED